ncbi:uncharacterized protein [Elaeis guineensis]|uniref:uncharacterized protein n=1 Tax=Elaeis guineensis var. tenera TaxID=51953 RepID=UPI003C6DA6FA
MAPFEALYGRKCRSPICWDDVGERRLLSLELVRQTIEEVQLIRKILQTARDRQKSYADNRRQKLEFEVGDHVILNVSPTKGLMPFRIRGKLSPRYMGPFKILDRVGEVAYKVALSPILSSVRNVFHVSMLKKNIPDPRHMVEREPLQLHEDLTYEEYPIQIIDRREQVLRHRTIPYVKVQWSNHSERKATWELESEMKERYPQLFVDIGM